MFLQRKIQILDTMVEKIDFKICIVWMTEFETIFKNKI